MRVPTVLVYAGNASYSVYLLHLSLSGMLLKILITIGIAPVLGSEVTYLLVLAATMALGCLAYSLVERPLLDALRREP